MVCRLKHIACILLYILLICFFSYRQPNGTFSVSTDAENKTEHTQTFYKKKLKTTSNPRHLLPAAELLYYSLIAFR